MQQYLASLPGAGYGQFEHKADSLIANSKYERSERLRMSRVTAIIPVSWLSRLSSACHGLLIITDNANTYKAQRDKNAENWKLANAAITDMQMRQRDVAVRSMQNTLGKS